MAFNPPVALSALQVTSPQITGDTLSVDSSALPLTILADQNTLVLFVTLFGNQFIFTNPTVVNGKNQFVGSVPIDTSQSGTTVQILGREFNVWQTNTPYALGATIVDSNGNIQKVAVAGTSGATQPVWPTTGTIVDGGVTWTFVGPFSNPTAVTTWIANNTFSAGAVIIDSNGNAQQATQTGKTAATAPVWAKVIGASTTDGTAQWICLGPPITPIFKFNLIFFNTGLALQIAPPSGLRAYKSQNDCKVEWVTPNFNGFIGVQVVISTDPAGINPPFTQYQNLVSAIERVENTAVGAPVVSQQVTTQQTITTTTQTTQQNNFSAVTIPSSAVNSDIFYAMVATLIQDPNTHTVYQSQYNGPVTCGFVNLRKVNPSDFLALQRPQDIAGRVITQITTQYPNLDLTPRSEIRDLVVDAFAVETANMSVREYFARVSTSISALSQIDNASGNGISDPFSTSPIKQQIARAYGLNPTDTQSLIDKQFDIKAEGAGLQRGGPTASVVTLTFYTFVKPTQSVVFPVQSVVASQGDSQTPSLNFITTGSASLSVGSVNSFFNPQFNWWQVQVPAQCQTSGTVGNVGAGKITQVVSGIPQGWNVTNLDAAAFGTDTESNAALAVRVQAREITGVDSGTRNGYFVASQSTPGVIQTIVVAAGDLYMLRDYDPVRVKHVFGAVDIYTRGLTFSEQTSATPFQYDNTSAYAAFANYVPLTLVNLQILKFSIGNFASFGLPFYDAVEVIVQRSGNTFYLGTQRATFDNVGGALFINPNDMAYIITGSGVTQAQAPLLINGQPATNFQAVSALAQVAASSFTIGLFARLQSPLDLIPSFQPVISVNSVAGNQATGVVPGTAINLIRTQDFFILGGSNRDQVTVSVNSTTSALITNTFSASSTLIPIDTAVDIAVDSGGNVITTKAVNSVTVPAFTVRSADLSTLYVNGVDYTFVPSGPYHAFSLSIPQTTQNNVPFIIPATAPFTVTPALNGGSFISDGGVTYSNLTPLTKVQSSPAVGQYSISAAGVYTFNSGDAGKGILISYTFGSSIPVGGINPVKIIVSYYKFTLAERLTFVTETDTLTSNTPTQLQQTGFVFNTWLPISYGNTTLVNDAGLIAALVPFTSRYIKVTFNNGATNVVMREGIDFTLTVNTTAGTATLTRILSGAIPDGATVTVSYFINETFTIATEFPAFVEILANTIAQSQAAAADVLIKAMLANPIDMTFTVTLDPSADANTVDANIRTAISITLDNASKKLAQSVLVQQIQNVAGVQELGVPFQKLAKSDGSYDIGVVIPTQTVWNHLGADPSFVNINVPPNSFISAIPVLPDATIPGGGLPNSFVGMLLNSGGVPNQPQAFRRASSIQDFLTNSGVPSFYIIGTNDQISATQPLSSAYAQRLLITVPTAVATPGTQSYFVTYQVFGEGGASDIMISPTEYFVTGHVVINYISTTGTNAGGL